MKVTIRYATHLPVLMHLVTLTTGPILELGVGLYSTPFLHFACLPTNRKLVSYENDGGWIRYLKDYRCHFHEVNLIDSWDKLDTHNFWDIIFVDHHPGTSRAEVTKRLANQAKYIILHDSDSESDNVYKYSQVYPLFKYRFDYTVCKPHTTVLSNFVDLSHLKI